MSEFFYDLTPDIVIQSVEDSGFCPTGRVFPMNSYENRVFDVYVENAPNIIVKFYRPNRWTKEEILEEHEFLFDLFEHEIPVSLPFRFEDNTTLKQKSGIYYSVWEKIGGRSPDEFQGEEFSIIGRLLGRIHKVGMSKELKFRPTFNSEEYIKKDIAYLENNDILPKSCVRRYLYASDEIAKIYSELSKEIPMHRIHGDCHKGNLLNGKGGWFFIDFDDFLTGPAIQDMWMLFPLNEDLFESKKNQFLEAYREFADFEDSWLNLIEPLRAFRFVHYSAWIAKRWADPAFPLLFPHFGTVEYWEKETNDLENQLQLIEKGTISQNHLEPDPLPELTNQDFFWDL